VNFSGNAVVAGMIMEWASLSVFVIIRIHGEGIKGVDSDSAKT
jgi:hypothetical protein